MAPAPPSRQGGRPGRPPRKAFLLRLPPEVMEQLRRWAASEFRSLNGHIEFLLRDALRRRGGPGADDAGPPGSRE